MESLLKKQSDSLSKIVDLSEDSKKAQLKTLSETEAIKSNSKQSDAEIVKQLSNVDDSLKQGFEKSKLANNMARLAKTMEKSFSGDGVGKVTDATMGRRDYRGLGERIRDKVVGKGGDKYDKDSLKYKFTTLRGFADMTGVVKHDSKGLFGDMLAKREDRQKFAENAVKLNPQEKNLKQYGGDESKVIDKYKKQFDSTQVTEKALRAKQNELNKLKEGGLSDEEIARTTGGKKLNKEKADLATTLGKTDYRFKGMAKAEEADATPDKQTTTTKSKAKNNVIPFPVAGGEVGGVKAGNDTQEAQNENARAMQEQTDLLVKIEENTRGATSTETKKEEPKKGKGIFGTIIDAIQAALGTALSSIGSLLMRGLTSAMKFLFNPANIMKMLKGFALVAIVGAVINGLIDGVKAFVATGSITEALIAGFGGMLEFLTFGLFDAESLRSLVDGISGFVNDYIIEPIKNFFGFLGESFDKYIAQPIMEAFSYIGGLFTEYIVDPIKKFFAPVADFFKKIKDQVFGFLEDFGIPEIGFTIPIIGKKVSIGPFYPFRPEKGENRVGGSSSLEQSSGPKGESSDFKQSVVSSGGSEYTGDRTNETEAQKRRRDAYSKDTTNVLDTREKVVDGKATYDKNLATFDPATGKSTLSGDAAGPEGQREISKRAFRNIKSNALKGNEKEVAEIVKEDDAYQKLSWFDKRKVDVGYAKATDLMTSNTPESANKVAGASATNDKAKMDAGKSQANNTVVAPTTNISNNTQNQVVKLPARNTDPAVTSYISSRYA